MKVSCAYRVGESILSKQRDKTRGMIFAGNAEQLEIVGLLSMEAVERAGSAKVDYGIFFCGVLKIKHSRLLSLVWVEVELCTR